MRRLNFKVEVRDNTLVVLDLNRGKSVTNDAENVIACIAESGFDLTLPVIYCDTTGQWDGIKVKDGLFVGFYSLRGATDYETARANLAEYRREQGEAA